jgi:hypothetical protein
MNIYPSAGPGHHGQVLRFDLAPVQPAEPRH